MSECITKHKTVVLTTFNEFQCKDCGNIISSRDFYVAIQSQLTQANQRITGLEKRVGELINLLHESIEWLDDVCYPTSEIANEHGVDFHERAKEALQPKDEAELERLRGEG